MYDVIVIGARCAGASTALLASAPNQTEPPFVIVQLLVLGMFAWLGRAALKGYPEAASGTPAGAPA